MLLCILNSSDDVVTPFIKLWFFHLQFLMSKNILYRLTGSLVETCCGAETWYGTFYLGIIEDNGVGFVAKQISFEVVLTTITWKVIVPVSSIEKIEFPTFRLRYKACDGIFIIAKRTGLSIR